MCCQTHLLDLTQVCQLHSVCECLPNSFGHCLWGLGPFTAAPSGTVFWVHAKNQFLWSNIILSSSLCNVLHTTAAHEAYTSCSDSISCQVYQWMKESFRIWVHWLTIKGINDQVLHLYLYLLCCMLQPSALAFKAYHVCIRGNNVGYMWLHHFLGVSAHPQMKPIVIYDNTQYCHVVFFKNPTFHATLNIIEIHDHLW